MCVCFRCSHECALLYTRACFRWFAVAIQLGSGGRIGMRAVAEKRVGRGTRWTSLPKILYGHERVVWGRGYVGCAKSDKQVRENRIKIEHFEQKKTFKHAETQLTVLRDHHVHQRRHHQHQHPRRHLQVPRYELRPGRAPPQGSRGVRSEPPPCRSISAGLEETLSPRPSIRESTAFREARGNTGTIVERGKGSRGARGTRATGAGGTAEGRGEQGKW